MIRIYAPSQRAWKPAMVIRIAVSRKLLVTLNAKTRDAQKNSFMQLDNQICHSPIGT